MDRNSLYEPSFTITATTTLYKHVSFCSRVATNHLKVTATHGGDDSSAAHNHLEDR